MTREIDNDAMTAAEVAVMWHTTVKRIYRFAADGQIPCLRLGGRILFSRDRLTAMLREGNNVTPATAEQADGLGS